MKELIAIVSLILVTTGSAAWTDEQQVNTGQDATRPLTRFDLRYQYLNLALPDHDNAHLFILRADRPFPLGKDWTLVGRVDLPLVLTNIVSLDNRNGTYEFGLGDILVQGLFEKSITQRFAVAAGAQFIFPTASEDQMGRGKYRIVPTVGARYDLPEISLGSFFLMAARYDVDYAGDDKRAHISELQLGPAVQIMLPNFWFLNLYPNTEIRYNFAAKRPGDTGRLFLPFDFLIGKLWPGKLVTSIEVSVPIIKEYKLYDFKMEARIGFFF